MERAYDDAKYGNFSRHPYIDMVIPSLTDPSVAPPGKHVMSCFVQYAPYKLRPGLNWDEQREAFGNNVIDTITLLPNASRCSSQFKPGLSLYGAYCTKHDITCLPGGATEGSVSEGITMSI